MCFRNTDEDEFRDQERNVGNALNRIRNVIRGKEPGARNREAFRTECRERIQEPGTLTVRVSGTKRRVRNVSNVLTNQERERKSGANSLARSTIFRSICHSIQLSNRWSDRTSVWVWTE